MRGLPEHERICFVLRMNDAFVNVVKWCSKPDERIGDHQKLKGALANLVQLKNRIMADGKLASVHVFVTSGQGVRGKLTVLPPGLARVLAQGRRTRAEEAFVTALMKLCSAEADIVETEFFVYQYLHAFPFIAGDELAEEVLAVVFFALSKCPMQVLKGNEVWQSMLYNLLVSGFHEMLITLRPKVGTLTGSEQVFGMLVESLIENDFRELGLVLFPTHHEGSLKLLLRSPQSGPRTFDLTGLSDEFLKIADPEALREFRPLMAEALSEQFMENTAAILGASELHFLLPGLEEEESARVVLGLLEETLIFDSSYLFLDKEGGRQIFGLMVGDSLIVFLVIIIAHCLKEGITLKHIVLERGLFDLLFSKNAPSEGELEVYYIEHYERCFQRFLTKVMPFENRVEFQKRAAEIPMPKEIRRSEVNCLTNIMSKDADEALASWDRVGDYRQMIMHAGFSAFCNNVNEFRQFMDFALFMNSLPFVDDLDFLYHRIFQTQAEAESI